MQCRLSVNQGTNEVLMEYPLSLDRRYRSTLDCGCLPYIWSNYREDIYMKVMNTSVGPRKKSCKSSVKWPGSPWVFVAQWIERPPGVWKVMGSNPIETHWCWIQFRGSSVECTIEMVWGAAVFTKALKTKRCTVNLNICLINHCAKFRGPPLVDIDFWFLVAWSRCNFTASV